jgi:hypothetical protein
MPTVTVGQENPADIEIHYSDRGAGQPAVGCDYDTFAADLPWTHADQVNTTLLGFIHS